MNFEPVLFSLAVGACVAGVAYCARDSYGHVIDAIERDLRLRMRSLRMPARDLRRWLHLWMLGIGAVFFGVAISLDSLVFGTLAAVFVCAGPWYIVRKMAAQRQQKVEDQLADAMVTFSSGVRAGLSLPQALEMLGQECPRPIRQEFQQIVGEYKLGKPLERTLEEAKARLRSENFILFAAALLASRESGGRLNETVERIAKSVLELQRLERKVRSETAQARKSAVYMAIVPAVLLVVYYFVDPVNTSLLFNTLPGQLLLSAAIILNVGAYFWALRILNADI